MTQGIMRIRQALAVNTGGATTGASGLLHMLAMSGSLSATRNQPSDGGTPQPWFNQERLQR